MEKNGSIYTGQVQNEMPHGSGEVILSDRRFKYVGGWANGKREGHGVCYFDGIKVFEGEYKNNWRHGKGCVFYYKDGSKSFVGEYVNDKRHGKGIEYAKDGTRRFGIWEEDKIKEWVENKDDFQYLEEG